MFKIGCFGYWEFTVKKLINEHYYKNYFEVFGSVIKVDEVAIIIQDADDIKYRIVWDRLEKFIRRVKPEK